MPRLGSVIPTRFAQACATDGFMEGCRGLLGDLAGAHTVSAVALSLAGAAGAPAAFIAVYAGASFIQWKRDQRNEHAARGRIEQMQRSLDRIEGILRADRDIAAIERELSELFQADASLRDRFGEVEVRTADKAGAEVEGIVRGVFDELGIEESFEDVRIYLSNISDWINDLRDEVREINDKQDVQLEDLGEIKILVQNIDRRQKAGGEHPPALSAEDERILAEARAHGDAKTKAQAAIMQRDFTAADPLIEAVTQGAAAELFDALTLKGDRHYYAGEFDAAIEPYEKALELRPNGFTARHNAANAHAQARHGSIEAHQRRAIEIHDGTLERVPHGSRDWAMTQNNLGNAYRNLPTSDRAGNLGRAIQAYEAALTVRTRDAHPVVWAGTQNNLGNAYAELPTGDYADNLGRAIKAYEAALTVRTRNAHPADWAATQNNLGTAYRILPPGNRADNLGRAIEAYEAALTVYTRSEHPAEWALTQNNLGNAYAVLSTGDRVGNLERSIEAYEAALTVRTRSAYPVDWAATQNNLGNAYRDLPTDDRVGNLGRAIEAYGAALTVYTGNAHPTQWALIQRNLGVAYADLADVPGEDRCGLLRLAISASKGALAVWTAEAFPHDHESTARNLAIDRAAYESGGCVPAFDDIPASE